MLALGRAKFVGCQSGSKNGNDWCVAYFDDFDNLLERVQFFVRDENLRKVKALQPGQDCQIQFRVSSRQGQNGTSTSIYLEDVISK